MGLVDHLGQRHTCHYRCRSRYCHECARARGRRVWHALRERAATAGTLVLVTLTQPAARGLSREELRERIDAHRDLWRRATRRLRLWRSRARRGAPRADLDAAVPPPSRYGAPHPEYASRYGSDGWRRSVASDDEWAWAWALEITPGRVGPARGGWHVHRHVLVPSRELGELISAAWQAAAQEAREVGPGEWVRTDLAERPGADPEAAAGYLASYCSGSKDAEALERIQSDAQRDLAARAYVRATHRLRRYDAAGAWRPLGLTAQAADRVFVGAVTDQWACWRAVAPEEYPILELEDARAELTLEPLDVRQEWRSLWRGSSSAWLWTEWTLDGEGRAPP